MRSRYRIELKEPVSVEEQWPIPVLSDGQFKIRTEDGKITAFEVSFTAQPVEYGFRRAADYKQGRLSIDWHDPRRNEMLDFLDVLSHIFNAITISTWMWMKYNVGTSPKQNKNGSSLLMKFRELALEKQRKSL